MFWATMSGFQISLCLSLIFLVTRAWLIPNYKAMPLQENTPFERAFCQTWAMAIAQWNRSLGGSGNNRQSKTMFLLSPQGTSLKIVIIFLAIWPTAVWRNLEVISQPYFTPLHLIGQKKERKEKKNPQMQGRAGFYDNVVISSQLQTLLWLLSCHL